MSLSQGRKDGQPNPGEDEALHALVTGPTEQSVQKAVAMVCVTNYLITESEVVMGKSQTEALQTQAV